MGVCTGWVRRDGCLMALDGMGWRLRHDGMLNCALNEDRTLQFIRPPPVSAPAVADGRLIPHGNVTLLFHIGSAAELRGNGFDGDYENDSSWLQIKNVTP